MNLKFTRNLLALTFIIILGPGISLAQNEESPFRFRGEFTLENRFYPEKGIYQNEDRSDVAFSFKPEFSYSWDQDRKVITFIPFGKLSERDQEKTHWDIRELSFVAAFEKWELRVGVSKVFWGVTESTHLIDVINQTDLVENPDGEDKLGQPMINPTLVTDWGNFSAFIMPYFRERTFPGREGRLRGPIAVDQNDPKYLHKDEERHIDWALRWNHYFRDLEWGLYYFRGTDRDPGFEANSNATQLRPVYGIASQGGLDLQYVYKDWLFKGEFLLKDSNINGDYFSTVMGFEYTFVNLWKGIDIGVLYEWIIDDRDELSPTGLDNASFVGTRLAFNDEKSTELLFGGFARNEGGGVTALRLESSRRISDNWKWELEANFILSPPDNGVFSQIKRDDYLQFNLSYFL